MGKDYYRILGVEKTATTKEIKRRYRELAMKYHPDRNPENARAAEDFREITEAYGVLGDPEKRKMYDAAGSGVTFDRQSVYEDIFERDDLGDVLDSFPLGRAWVERLLELGRIVAFEAVVVGGRPSHIIRRSLARYASESLSQMFHRVMDMHETLVLSESLMRTGGHVTIEYRPGIARRSIRVKVPPGIREGTVLRVRRMGRRNLLNIPGDLYLHVSMERSYKTT